MRTQRLSPAIVLVLTLSLGATACAPAGDRAQAADAVAVKLLGAVRAHDGTAACALLAPDTAAEVAQSGQKSCADAILDEDLPAPGAVNNTDVYGQWAQVRLSDDTVFLAVFPGGWRVVAAGCTSRGQRPYDCTLQGG